MNMDFVYDKEDDIHYVCSLLDFIARKTDNYISDVISYFNVNEISWHLKYAQVKSKKSSPKLCVNYFRHNIMRLLKPHNYQPPQMDGTVKAAIARR